MDSMKTIDKEHIISPYACKQEAEIEKLKTKDEEMKEIMCEIRDDIKTLTKANERIAVTEVKVQNLEDKVDLISTRLWYVVGATLVSIIGFILNLL